MQVARHYRCDLERQIAALVALLRSEPLDLGTAGDDGSGAPTSAPHPLKELSRGRRLRSHRATAQSRATTQPAVEAPHV